MKFRPKNPANENAAHALPRLTRQFFKSGDSVVRHGAGPAKVHRFRILAKRLRYALEYFGSCYGQTLEAYMGRLKDLQSALGDLSDCSSSRDLLMDLVEARNSPRRHHKLIAALKIREKDLLEAFRGMWTDKFGAPEFRKRWLRYLSHPPKRLRVNPR